MVTVYAGISKMGREACMSMRNVCLMLLIVIAASGVSFAQTTLPQKESFKSYTEYGGCRKRIQDECSAKAKTTQERNACSTYANKEACDDCEYYVVDLRNNAFKPTQSFQQNCPTQVEEMRKLHSERKK